MLVSFYEAVSPLGRLDLKEGQKMVIRVLGRGEVSHQVHCALLSSRISRMLQEHTMLVQGRFFAGRIAYRHRS